MGWRAVAVLPEAVEDRVLLSQHLEHVGRTAAVVRVGAHEVPPRDDHMARALRRLHHDAGVVGPHGIVDGEERLGVWASEAVEVADLDGAEQLLPRCPPPEDPLEALRRRVVLILGGSAGVEHHHQARRPGWPERDAEPVAVPATRRDQVFPWRQRHDAVRGDGREKRELLRHVASFPKMLARSVHPFSCPWLLAIRNRSPAIAFTRCR